MKNKDGQRLCFWNPYSTSRESQWSEKRVEYKTSVLLDEPLPEDYSIECDDDNKCPDIIIKKPEGNVWGFLEVDEKQHVGYEVPI